MVNAMAYVSELTGEPRIYAAIGGTHLLGASPARLQKTAEALRQYGVQKVMLSRCTDVQAHAELAAACRAAAAGPPAAR